MFDQTRRRCAAFLAAALLAAPLSAAPPTKKTPRYATNGIAGTFSQPDPKNPKWLLYALTFKGMQAAQTLSNNYLGTMQEVRATFYQKGRATALMTAPVARADYNARTVTGSRRVACRSLIERGTTLTADNMTWYSAQNKIMASGNVVYVNGRTHGVLTTNVLYLDTTLKRLYTNTPGKGVLPQGF